MRLTMLGTGNALVTECYNTCFIIEDNNKRFMVDAGGGNTILKRLKDAGFALTDLKEIFITHKHIDHILGAIWIIRMLCQLMAAGKYEGEANIYAHDEVIFLLRDAAKNLLTKKQSDFIDERLHLITVTDGEKRVINGRNVTFFDIHSTKAKQYGFSMELDNSQKLTCCGDEPYNPCEKSYAENSTWLMHEAFCLYSQADIFDPYKKHHSTVKDASETAQSLSVENLILYHTEDSNLANRKELYTAEGEQYFSGKLYVPDDMETIEL